MRSLLEGGLTSKIKSETLVSAETLITQLRKRKARSGEDRAREEMSEKTKRRGNENDKCDERGATKGKGMKAERQGKEEGG